MKSLGNFPDPFIAEIAGQPDALRRAGTGAIEQTGALEAAGAPARRGRVVPSGVGSSYDARHPARTALALGGGWAGGARPAPPPPLPPPPPPPPRHPWPRRA